MKILHTADVHLREEGDSRWEAMVDLLRIGRQQNIDLVVVCGDLFDSPSSSEALRPSVRTLFTGNGFPIILLPGNHDHLSYGEGKYFGEDCFVINDTSTRFSLGDLTVAGIPFKPAAEEELLLLLRAVNKSLDPQKPNLLLFHGELLDSFYSRDDFGGEGNERYMPVRLAAFEGLPVSMVLAGHFHRTFDVRVIPGGGYFVYPGSPVSVTRKETGRRRVNLFSLGSPPSEYLLDTPHFEEVAVELDPWEGKDPVLSIEEKLRALHPAARIFLTVAGYVDGGKSGLSETEAVRRMEESFAGRCESRTYLFRDVRSVLEDDLYLDFLRRLEESGVDEKRRQRLLHVAVRAMMEAGL